MSSYVIAAPEVLAVTAGDLTEIQRRLRRPPRRRRPRQRGLPGRRAMRCRRLSRACLAASPRLACRLAVGRQTHRRLRRAAGHEFLPARQHRGRVHPVHGLDRRHLRRGGPDRPDIWRLRAHRRLRVPRRPADHPGPGHGDRAARVGADRAPPLIARSAGHC